MTSACISVLALIVSTTGIAAEWNLGKDIPLNAHPENGSPAFGAVYTYGDDPDGSHYLLTFTPQVGQSEASWRYRWNFYLRSKDTYLLDWSSARTTQLVVVQISVGDSSPAQNDVVSKILLGQRKVAGSGELYFVLADNNNIPVYSLSISDLCAAHPESFSDLTNGSACNEIRP